MSRKPMGQHERRNNATHGRPSKTTEIPEHDLARKRQRPLNINGLAARFFRYGTAVFAFLSFVVMPGCGGAPLPPGGLGLCIHCFGEREVHGVGVLLKDPSRNANTDPRGPSI
jgi:hypothetical protein